jgi:cyclopropane-fatty-acyl-phospholipid synthase
MQQRRRIQNGAGEEQTARHEGRPPLQAVESFDARKDEISQPPSVGKRRSYDMERRLLEKLLGGLGNPRVAVYLWDGHRVGPDRDVLGSFFIHDPLTLHRLLIHPELHFGEAYTSGALTVDGSLAELITEIAKHRPVLPLTRLKNRLLRPLTGRRGNSPGRARQNIHRHYDLGNDFYRLWLDERMVYTCAYFPEPDTPLEAAQIAKMDHVCRKLWLGPGDTVVEAGCGWGALAMHMARAYGARVKAFNISTEQIKYARERAKAEGLEDRVEFILGDYREIEGRYDAFVSVGMLEHVGADHYATLGRTMNRVLQPHGRALIHSIGRDRPRPMNAWIDKYIFPGAYPPSLREMLTLFEPWGLSVLDVENIRLHYARTLEHWLDRFEASRDQVLAMFDERFLRMWRMYLASSISAFKVGDLQLFQVVAAPVGSNHIPWRRGHLSPG